MNQITFEQLRKGAWQRFEEDLTKVKSRYRLDEPSRIDEFLSSYEDISNDLALAQSRGYSRLLIERLNALVEAGHNTIHSSRSNWVSKIAHFLLFGFPMEVRKARWYVAVALVAFVLPGFVASIMVIEDNRNIYSIVPAELVRQMESSYGENRKRLADKRSEATDLAMFGFYVQNNASIGLRLFAFGIVYCFGSLLVLVVNGVFLGAVITYLVSIGYGSNILSFVSGHGPLELTAIVLAGAAGLMLGFALISPGTVTRLAKLKSVATPAVLIVLGSVIMFFLAAVIEAFWSSSSYFSHSTKYAVGAVLWVAVFAYFLVPGRSRAA